MRRAAERRDIGHDIERHSIVGCVVVRCRASAELAGGWRGMREGAIGRFAIGASP